MHHKSNTVYQLVPDLPYIHPSEVSLVNRVCRLGSHYQALHDFVNRQTSSLFDAQTSTEASDLNQGYTV